MLPPSLNGILVTLPAPFRGDDRRPRIGRCVAGARPPGRRQAVPVVDTPHRYIGSMVLGVVIGLVVGLAIGVAWHLARLARTRRRRPSGRGPAGRRAGDGRRRWRRAADGRPRRPPRPRRPAPSPSPSSSCSRASEDEAAAPGGGGARAAGRRVLGAVGAGAGQEQRAVPHAGRLQAQRGPHGHPGRPLPAPAGDRAAAGPAERDPGPLRARAAGHGGRAPGRLRHAERAGGGAAPRPRAAAEGDQEPRHGAAVAADARALGRNDAAQRGRRRPAWPSTATSRSSRRPRRRTACSGPT